MITDKYCGTKITKASTTKPHTIEITATPINGTKIKPIHIHKVLSGIKKRCTTCTITFQEVEPSSTTKANASPTQITGLAVTRQLTPIWIENIHITSNLAGPATKKRPSGRLWTLRCAVGLLNAGKWHSGRRYGRQLASRMAWRMPTGTETTTSVVNPKVLQASGPSCSPSKIFIQRLSILGCVFLSDHPNTL